MENRDTLEADLKTIESGNLKNHPQVQEVLEQLSERTNLKKNVLEQIDNSKFNDSVFKKYRKEIEHSLELDCFSRKDIIHQMVLQNSKK